MCNKNRSNAAPKNLFLFLIPNSGFRETSKNSVPRSNRYQRGVPGSFSSLLFNNVFGCFDFLTRSPFFSPLAWLLAAVLTNTFESHFFEGVTGNYVATCTLAVVAVFFYLQTALQSPAIDIVYVPKRKEEI
jgi:hypothetical protein